VGTNGFAKEVGQLAGLINKEKKCWNRIEYLTENKSNIGAELPYGRVAGADEMLNREEAADVVIGIGRPDIRQKIGEILISRPWLSAPNLIHPKSEIDLEWVEIGKGNILTCGSVFTCNIVVGDYNVFNLNCTIGHDVRIGSYTVINPGCNISGGVVLGDRCLLGTGVQVLENLGVVSDVTIGAGALVSKSIVEPATYIGIPAKLLK